MSKNNMDAIFSNVDIVVAHYSEDIEWLKPYAKYVTIYHKGKEEKPRFPVKKWAKIENVGREGETYLQHIINNYDNLADITIFLQGGMHDQLYNKVAYGDLEEYVKEVKKYGFSTSRTRIVFRKDPQIIFEGKTKEQYNNGSMSHAEYSFAGFYEKIYGEPQPLIFPCFFCANFAVTKEKIYSRPKKFYENIHKYLARHVNPEEGHYLERLWFRSFNDKLNFHYLIKILVWPFQAVYAKLSKVY